ITNHQSPITNHQSPITNHQSPITKHQSPITNATALRAADLCFAPPDTRLASHNSPFTIHASPFNLPCMSSPALLTGLAIAIAGILYGGLYEPVFMLPSFLLLAAAGGWIAAGMMAGSLSLRHPAPLLALALSTYVCVRGFAFNPSTGIAVTILAAAAGLAYLSGAVLANGGGARWIWAGLLLAAALLQMAAGWRQLSQTEAAWTLPWLSEQLRGWYSSRSGDRLHGFFLNANHLAWLLNFAGLTALALAVWARIHPLPKVLLAAAAALAFWGSFQTLSRGGLLALAAGLLTFGAISGSIVLFRVGRLRWPLALVGTALAIGGFLVLNTGLERLPQYSVRFLIAAHEGDYRDKIWPTAWRQFQTAPVFGTGSGTYAAHGRMYREDLHFSDPRFAHNDWLQFLAENGAAGMALLIAALLAHVATAKWDWRRLKAEPRFQEGFPQDTTLGFRIGAFACLAAAAVHSLFDFNLHLPANLLLAAVCLGMTAGNGEPARAGREWLPRGAAGIIPLALAVFLLAHAVRNGPPWIRDLQAQNALQQDRLKTAALLLLPPGTFNAASAGAWQARGDLLKRLGERTPEPQAARQWLAMAAAAFDRARQLDPQERFHELKLAATLLQLGDASAVLPLAARTMEFDPLDAQPYLVAGAAAEMQGQIRAARQFYALASRLPHTGNLAERQLQKLTQEPRP
ncbi:MAG TPA: O-antigen ligase family protein, partial [Chthoniobacterales bacterium]